MSGKRFAWVVTGETGAYSDWCMWLVRVFDAEAEAQAHARDLTAKAKIMHELASVREVELWTFDWSFDEWPQDLQHAVNELIELDPIGTRDPYTRAFSTLGLPEYTAIKVPACGAPLTWAESHDCPP